MVEKRGIEPRSSVCKTAALPLSYIPVLVPGARFERAFTALQAGAITRFANQAYLDRVPGSAPGRTGRSTPAYAWTIGWSDQSVARTPMNWSG